MVCNHVHKYTPIFTAQLFVPKKIAKLQKPFTTSKPTKFKYPNHKSLRTSKLSRNTTVHFTTELYRETIILFLSRDIIAKISEHTHTKKIRKIALDTSSLLFLLARSRFNVGRKTGVWGR